MNAQSTPRRPSEITRDAIRRAIRSCPRWSREEHGDPSTLTKDALNQLAKDLGLNPTALAAAALRQANINPAEAAEAEADDTAPAEAPAEADPAPQDKETPVQDDEVLAAVSKLREEMLDRGFNAVAPTIADLIREARKPAEIRIVEKLVEVQVPMPPPLPPGVHDLKPKTRTSWGKLFGVTGDLSGRAVTVWDHPDAPAPSKLYRFPTAETALALSQMARSENARAANAPAKHVLLWGPAGTGKSTWAREFAARTGRPFVSIPLSDGIEMDQLVGQTVLDGEGGVKWQDGLLLAAIRQPGMVVCLDEVGGMRPAVGVALNGLLQDMVYYIPDTGERVEVAPHVVIIATNNANLMENGAARGYVGIGRQNRAFADRFGVAIEIGYAEPATEAQMLCDYTGCTAKLASLLVSVATITRTKAQGQGSELTHGIGFRRLLAWAETLSDGVDPELAFRAAILNNAPDEDAESLRQTAAVAIDPRAIADALKGRAPATGAAAVFDDESEGA